MRFQQKQKLERDQKKVDTTTTSSSRVFQNSNSNSESLTTSSSIGAGKVRQMFDERRHRVIGVDKSYPLQPITTANKTTSNTVANNNANSNNHNSTAGVVASSKSGTNRQTTTNLNSKTRVPPISSATTTKFTVKDNSSNGNYNYLSHDDNDNLLNEKFPDIPIYEDETTRKLQNMNKLSLNGNHNNHQSNNGHGNVAVKLKPVNRIKQQQQPLSTNNNRSSTGGLKLSSPLKSNQNSAKSFNEATTAINNNNRSNASPIHHQNNKSITLDRSSANTVKQLPDDMSQCTYCGRNFNSERLAKHEEICQKTLSKKRKVFDSTKHRVEGTEAESYLKKSNQKTRSKSIQEKQIQAVSSRKNDWRRKHEEFINAIRAAKEVQAHIAKGGKLSDLPPPPPSENPDYIQCPHCLRRFNETAANRHIPKCATMLHNKPKNKPSAPVRKRY
uniref:C2HC/C3H-type domain-containing protein n=1 Tax=Corethrella appendiculata TaxID=1370023 RepID=U5EPU9_9DIPT